MFNLWRYIGVRHLTEKPLRTLLTILGVSLGISLFVAIKLINESTLDAFEENIRSVTGNAILTVTGGEAGFPEAKLDEIGKVPGVKSTVPLVETKAYVVGRGKSETLNVFGVDLLREGSVRKYQGTKETPIDDFLTFLNQPDSIVVTKVFADKHGLTIDAPLQLMTAHGIRQFTVRGFLSPNGPAKAYGGSIAIMDIDGARVMFGKEDKVDRVDLTMPGEPDAAAVSDLQSRLEKVLGAGYRVAKPEGQAESLEKMVGAFQKFLSFVSTLAILIGLFMVGNTISVSVSEKRSEIGSLRALGATKIGIFQLFVGEAAIIGGIGGMVGASLGVLFAKHLGGAVAHSMSQRFLTEISEPTIHFGLRNIFRATLAGAGVSVLAALLPSRRAMRIQPIEAIRRTAQSVQEDSARWLHRTFLAGCTALLILIAFLYSEKVAESSRFEGLIQVLVLLVINLTAPFVAYWLFRAVKALIVKAESAVGRLALDNLLRSPKRTSGNILVLMVGLVLFVTVTTVHSSFRNSISDWLDRVLQADLVVASYGNIAAFQTQPLHESIVKDLASVPELTAGLEVPLRGMRFIRLNVKEVNVALKAYDEPDPSTRYHVFDFRVGNGETSGKALFHAEEPSILISTNLAKRVHEGMGDLLSVDTPQGPVNFRIVGIINDFTSGDGVIAMSRKRYQEYWRDPLLTLVYVKLKPGVSAEAVRSAVDGQLGASKSLQLTMNQDLKAEVARAIDKGFGFLHSIEIASLLIALLALLNTLLISIIERRRELGLLRAAGMSRPQLFGMILTESAVLGMISVVLSVVMGALLSLVWVTHSLESLVGWSVPYSFPASTIGGAGILGVTVCLIAAIYPASRAAFLPITEAISHD